MLSCSYLLPLPKLLQPTISFSPSHYILISPRYSNDTYTEGILSQQDATQKTKN
jgi:hypothetical protein